ncbi:MAG: hypothetical protein ACK41T_09205 [Pseudobdellovibrio sp.]
MKKSIGKLITETIFAIITVFIIYISFPWINTYWSNLFPKFKAGSCVLDQQTHQILQIGPYIVDIKYGKQLTAKVLKANENINQKVNDTVIINDKDTTLKPIDCNST